MSDNQKLPPPKPITKSLTYTIGNIQVSQNTKENMSDSGVAPQETLNRLEKAIKSGAFEGLETKNE